MKGLPKTGKAIVGARDSLDAARDYVFLALLLTPVAIDCLWTPRFDSTVQGSLLTYLFDILPLVLLAVVPRYWWTFRECAMRRVDAK